MCKVTMSTICGSDLHTISGRRVEPTPLILGHEIIGEIAALGEGLERDGFGQELKPGDRVSWSIMACCGRCFYCEAGLPQKCEHLQKYGHTSCDGPPHLTGGYAEYIQLFPGTSVFRVPESLSDEVATPANCALSTVIHGAEAIELQEGESVLIQGAGLLGLNLIALAIEAGARDIAVTDVAQSRLDMAAAFGATLCLNLKELGVGEAAARLRERTGGHGVDVAFEVSGAEAAVAQAVDALRLGGRYLIAGLVTPGGDLGMQGNQVTRGCLTIKGIHNYRPEHLGQALRFLDECSARYPYDRLVGETFSLDRIGEAVETAISGRYIRVAVRPFESGC